MERREQRNSLLLIAAAVLAVITMIWLLWTAAADRRKDSDRQSAVFVRMESEEKLNG